MNKAIKILFAFVVSWMFFFPMTFQFLPSYFNSKMMMAVLGIYYYVRELFRGERAHIALRRDLVLIGLLAILFSISCFFSITYNNTSDMDYVTYIVSMCVWLGAAYASVETIHNAHDKSDLVTVGNYIIALCTVQVLVSLLFTMVPAVRFFLSQYIVIGENTVSWENRLYGLGTSSDTGGIHFCMGLLFIAYFLSKPRFSAKERFIYLVCFMLIFAIGNLMSRTTTIGGIMAIGYYLFKTRPWRLNVETHVLKTVSLFAVMLLAMIPILILSYNTSKDIQDLAHFGFEGFFNYFENGEWSTRSNDNLRDMMAVWPDNMKTWLIGDGRFLDPYDNRFFYMRTDVGYARFIFYCGLIGLSIFSVFFINIFFALSKRMREHTELFLLFLLLEFVVWIKVSTDIFLIFAVLLLVDQEEEDDDEDDVLEDEEIPELEAGF